MRPRQWLNSGGLGTMGFGLPSAIGAKVACPDQDVICLAGDGSLVMTCQELATAVAHQIPVKVFLMNNGVYGMVRQWQELFWDRRYSSIDMGGTPDWVKLADAFGATGMRVTHKDEVTDAFKTALETDGPVLVDVDARGELLSDDPRGERGQGYGRLMGEPGTAEVLNLEDLEAVSGLRTGRKHVVSILVENKPGVLARVSGLFARRGFNIETLAVGPTDDPTTSRITLTVDGAAHPIDQVTKQLHKLVNVLKIRDLEPEEMVARELALFKLSADAETRPQILQYTEIFRGKVVDVDKRSVTVEITGADDKIEAFERMVRPFGLIEMVRTGEIAVARGRGAT
jgi:acetolactate synthase-1/3 small subunit